MPEKEQQPAEMSPLQQYHAAAELTATAVPIRVLVMAILIGGESNDVNKAKAAYPWLWEEVTRRSFSAGGRLPTDQDSLPNTEEPQPQRTLRFIGAESE